jgi:hypothetical protein
VELKGRVSSPRQKIGVQRSKVQGLPIYSAGQIVDWQANSPASPNAAEKNRVRSYSKRRRDDDVKSDGLGLTV